MKLINLLGEIITVTNSGNLGRTGKCYLYSFKQTAVRSRSSIDVFIRFPNVRGGLNYLLKSYVAAYRENPSNRTLLDVNVLYSTTVYGSSAGGYTDCALMQIFKKSVHQTQSYTLAGPALQGKYRRDLDILYGRFTSGEDIAGELRALDFEIKRNVQGVIPRMDVNVLSIFKDLVNYQAD